MNRKKYMLGFILFLLVIALLIGTEREDRFVRNVVEVKAESLDDSSLENKIKDVIIQDQRLNGAITGISVRNANTGQEVFAHAGNVRLHPASNMKILTSIAALEVLGTNYQFTTKLFADGEIVGDTLQGNLYIKGQGDPTLMEADLDHFATKLTELGIKSLGGSIVGDDSWYDDIRLSQDLNWSDEPFHTGAQVSALTLSPNKDFDAGSVLLEVSPNKVGEPATINITPKTDYVKLINKTNTVQQGGNKSISFDRAHGKNLITVKGDVPVDVGITKSWVAVWEPTGYVLDVFKKSLEKKGVKIKDSVLKVGEVPDDATLIVKKDSMPLSELLIPFMKLSNNGHGEVLVKEMGKVVHNEGSWEKGLDVMEQTIDSFGINSELIQIRDGSGMSHKNYVTASQMTKLLYDIQKKEWFDAFMYSLPIAGEAERLTGGTLRKRMSEEPLKGNVKAKTGSLTGVNTLSGYLTNAEGDTIIFSILLNNYVDDPVTDIQDKIVHILANHTFE